MVAKDNQLSVWKSLENGYNLFVVGKHHVLGVCMYDIVFVIVKREAGIHEAVHKRDKFYRFL